jgi:hypothetical protein
MMQDTQYYGALAVLYYGESLTKNSSFDWALFLDMEESQLLRQWRCSLFGRVVWRNQGRRRRDVGWNVSPEHVPSQTAFGAFGGAAISIEDTSFIVSHPPQCIHASPTTAF